MDWLKRVINRFRTKVYVKRYSASYFRVTGPQAMLDTITSFGGYIVIGADIDITHADIQLVPGGEINIKSISGVPIDQMELVPLSLEDHKILHDRIAEDIRKAIAR